MTSGCISSRRATRSKAAKTFSKPSSPPTRLLIPHQSSSYMRRGGRCLGFQFRRNDSGSAPLDCQIVFAMSSSLLAFERAGIVPLRSAARPSFRKVRYLGISTSTPAWISALISGLASNLGINRTRLLMASWTQYGA